MDIDKCISNVNSHITEVIVIEDSVTKDSVIEDSVIEDSVIEDSVIEDSVTEGKFNFIEVCAGGGGLSCGLCKSGLHPILLNDIDKNSCETLKSNHPETNIYKGSFTEIDYTKYINKCDVLCGGVPCQSFSYAGKQKGLDDKRGDLIIKFSEMINIIKPKIFMIENVKGLLTHNKGETIKHIINNCLNKYDNYNIDYKLIKCVRHKIPQKRERLVIIGILKKYKFNFNFPEESDDIITIKDALKNVPKSVGAKYPEKKIKYFEKIPPGGCWINLDIDDQKEYLGNGYYSGGGKRGLLRKLSWSEPCLTILCSPAQKNTERCHPDENRPLTVRESARIQTFSDDYKFSGSMSSQYSQIGNAVPVRLGELLGLELINSLSTMVDNSP
jgi:DNA (cytosine-5)-methyltransferase 1